MIKPKILVGITSARELPIDHLRKVLDIYNSYTKYDVTIVLAAAYPFTYSGNLNIINVSSSYKGWDYCYSTHQYLFDNYQSYDYVISTDDDIFIEEKVIDYYAANVNLPLEYIAGVLSYEVDNNGNKKLLAAKRVYRNIITERVTIDNKEYAVFFQPHSCCFIADRKRFQLSIQKGLSVVPQPRKRMTTCDWARDSIYVDVGMKKVVAIEDILNGNALVHHSSNKYINHPMMNTLTPQQLFNVSVPASSIETKKKLRGLGDVVAIVAQPIAKTIDKISHGRTNVAGCGGCQKRRQALNKIIPFK